MNFLAHLYLGGAGDARRVGAILGDFARGPLNQVPARYRHGVWLHRRIDSYTDAHARHRLSRSRVSGLNRRWAGVLVDIFYDHFLARDWDRYAEQGLASFSADCYRALDAHRASVPERMRRSIDYMRGRDLLRSYRRMEGIAEALRGLQGRVQRDNQIAAAIEDLRRDYSGFEADFAAFFPALRAAVAEWEREGVDALLRGHNGPPHPEDPTADECRDPDSDPA